MKKKINLLMILGLLVISLAACGNSNRKSSENTEEIVEETDKKAGRSKKKADQENHTIWGSIESDAQKALIKEIMQDENGRLYAAEYFGSDDSAYATLQENIKNKKQELATEDNQKAANPEKGTKEKSEATEKTTEEETTDIYNSVKQEVKDSYLLESIMKSKAGEKRIQKEREEQARITKRESRPSIVFYVIILLLIALFIVGVVFLISVVKAHKNTVSEMEKLKKEKKELEKKLEEAEEAQEQQRKKESRITTVPKTEKTPQKKVVPDWSWEEQPSTYEPPKPEKAPEKEVRTDFDTSEQGVPSNPWGDTIVNMEENSNKEPQIIDYCAPNDDSVTSANMNLNLQFVLKKDVVRDIAPYILYSDNTIDFNMDYYNNNGGARSDNSRAWRQLLGSNVQILECFEIATSYGAPVFTVEEAVGKEMIVKQRAKLNSDMTVRAKGQIELS